MKISLDIDLNVRQPTDICSYIRDNSLWKDWTDDEKAYYSAIQLGYILPTEERSRVMKLAVGDSLYQLYADGDMSNKVLDAIVIDKLQERIEKSGSHERIVDFNLK